MNDIKRIFHIGDIHIRNYQRHAEYKKVFTKLFKYLDKNKRPGDVIYLAGDIVHQKTEMTPELIAMTTLLLRECANRLPTVLITGNHDTNLNNENRLDALTPIVDSLKHPNLHYWKDNGVYKINPDDNISWSVFSIFNTPAEWIRASEIKTKDIKIALHHGAVSGAKTDLEHEIINDVVSGRNFTGFNYVLLGDIHKRQFIKRKTIAYCGSLIQQNYGEDLSHGFLIWDLEKEESEYVEIKNEIAYATIVFKNNKRITTDAYINSLPKYIRLRIKYESTDKSIIDLFLNEFKSRFVVKEYNPQKISTIYNISNKSTKIGDVRDIEYQNSLIDEYLKQTDATSEQIDNIRYLNRNYNVEINAGYRFVRNTIWKLKEFEFSNMFSYGPNNKINFEKLHDIQGIFSANATGKSSILDALTFILFDKCSRTFKATDIINNRKSHFSGRVIIELNGTEYVIERSGEKNKHGKIRVNTNFYRINETGIDDLKGEDRDGTNRNIREYIGTYDDFLMTALSVQNDNKNFVFKSQRERKELLYGFLDISVFTEVYEFIKGKIKEQTAILNELKSKSNIQIETELINKIEQSKISLNSNNRNLDKHNAKINEIQNEINELSKLLIILPDVRKTADIESDIQTGNEKIKEMLSSANELKTQKAKLNSDKLELTNQIDGKLRTKDELELMSKAVKSISDSINILKQESIKVDHQLTISKEAENDLHNHAFDPNCEYCVNSEFVKNAKDKIKSIATLIKMKETIESEINSYTLDLNNKTEIYKRAKLNFDRITNINKIESSLESLNSKINLKKLEFNNLMNTMRSLEAESSSVKDYQKQLETNNEIGIKIKNLQDIKEDIIADKSRTEKDIISLESSIAVDSFKLEELVKQKEEINAIEKRLELHTLYMDAVSPVGIPYMLLTKVLPILEDDVNKLLSEITNFSISLITDDKDILCNINYSNGDTWPVELGSGMEKFIVSIALRSALVNVTSLPRPNFMAIDEGFGVLDSDNVINAFTLMNKIKDNFDFLICISHLDLFKELVNNSLTIHRKKDFSFINNTIE